jgi:hypothetical protein
MSAVTHAERQALQSVASLQTIMEKLCMYCGAHCGYKDGLGVRGPSHTICPECKKDGKCGVDV